MTTENRPDDPALALQLDISRADAAVHDARRFGRINAGRQLADLIEKEHR